MLRAVASLSICYTSLAYSWDHSKVHVMEHANKQCLLSILRNKDSTQEEFTAGTSRLLRLLLEYTLGLEPMKTSKKQTPLNVEYQHYELTYGKNYCVVVILRAANCMLNETLSVLPGASTGFVLIQRDEGSREKLPIYYYSKFPKEMAGKRILLVDPMLGTGGSAITAIQSILKAGGKEENIVFINLVGCERGISAVLKEFPSVRIVTAQVDGGMNEDLYLVPGIGDFGDRYYGT